MLGRERIHQADRAIQVVGVGRQAQRQPDGADDRLRPQAALESLDRETIPQVVQGFLDVVAAETERAFGGARIAEAPAAHRDSLRVSALLHQVTWQRTAPW